MLGGSGFRPHERFPELAWLLNSVVKEKLSVISYQFSVKTKAASHRGLFAVVLKGAVYFWVNRR
jgi:hypothetical protein